VTSARRVEHVLCDTRATRGVALPTPRSAQALKPSRKGKQMRLWEKKQTPHTLIDEFHDGRYSITDALNQNSVIIEDFFEGLSNMC
jgi:hypothetical protein